MYWYYVNVCWYIQICHIGIFALCLQRIYLENLHRDLQRVTEKGYQRLAS